MEMLGLDGDFGVGQTHGGVSWRRRLNGDVGVAWRHGVVG